MAMLRGFRIMASLWVAWALPLAAFAQYSPSGTVNLGNAYGAAAAQMGPASLANSTLCLSSPVFCHPGSSSGPSKPSAAKVTPLDRGLNKQIQDAVLSPLTPEYQRRIAADGQERAQTWYLAAVRDLGRRAGSLAPEYRRRVAAQGQRDAAAWYVAAAGKLGRDYALHAR